MLSRRLGFLQFDYAFGGDAMLSPKTMVRFAKGIAYSMLPLLLMIEASLLLGPHRAGQLPFWPEHLKQLAALAAVFAGLDALAAGVELCDRRKRHR